MRILIYALFLFPMFSFSQVNEKLNTKDIVFEYYLDSAIIDKKNTILPSILKDINVITEGNVVKTYLSSVKHNICLVNLNSIYEENINLLSNKVFIIDDIIIKKPSEIKIDKNEIENVEIVLSSEIEDQTSDFLIIKISTKSKQRRIINSKNRGTIMIKG